MNNTVPRSDRTYGCIVPPAAAPQPFATWTSSSEPLLVQTPGLSPCITRFANNTLATKLYTIAPLVQGYALLGEPSKFVGVSSDRFITVDVGAKGVHASLLGAANEVVEVMVVTPMGLKVVRVVLDDIGEGVLQVA